MKNKLLITTALVALVSASNAYADALNIADGETHNIIAKETVDSLSMTGGNLIGTSDVDGSILVSGNADISGGTVDLTGHYDENEDNERYSDIEAAGKVTISGDNTIVNIEQASISAHNGFEISGGKITLGKEGDLVGVTEISGGKIDASNVSEINGRNLAISGGKVSLNNGSKLRDGGDISISDKAEINIGKDSILFVESIADKGIVSAESDHSINISGGAINLNDNASIIRGTTNRLDGGIEELVTENIDTNVKGGINMTGGVVNMNGTSSIEVYTTDGKLALDGSSITGSTPEELLAKAPTINVNGNNKIVSDVDVKDGLIKVNKGATLTSGDISLASGNFASIIDIAGTLNANVSGSDKAQMTFFDSNAKVKGTVDNIKDVNIRSNLSLASAFEKGATNIDNINVYG